MASIRRRSGLESCARSPGRRLAPGRCPPAPPGKTSVVASAGWLLRPCRASVRRMPDQLLRGRLNLRDGLIGDALRALDGIFSTILQLQPALYDLLAGLRAATRRQQRSDDSADDRPHDQAGEEGQVAVLLLHGCPLCKFYTARTRRPATK